MSLFRRNRKAEDALRRALERHMDLPFDPGRVRERADGEGLLPPASAAPARPLRPRRFLPAATVAATVTLCGLLTVGGAWMIADRRDDPTPPQTVIRDTGTETDDLATDPAPVETPWSATTPPDPEEDSGPSRVHSVETETETESETEAVTHQKPVHERS